MTYRTHSDYYIPRSKADLLKAILPTWAGSKTSLREYSTARLRAIFRAMREKTLMGLMKG